jgi:predicted amidohydrolase
MKIAVVQIRPEFGDVRGNLQKIEASVAGTDASIFVFPELSLSGYLFESAGEARSLAQKPEGPEFQTLAKLARSRSAAVVVGFAELAPEGVYNSALLLEPRGGRFVYRKIQLFWDEKRIFLPGDRPPSVVDIGIARLGLMICFDWIFPEVARSLALGGADILCHPSNLVLPYCQDAMITRSLENRVFSATSNRIGTERRAGRELAFTGGSVIVSPGGEVLARAAAGAEEVLVAEIDPGEARRKQITPTNDVLADRRTGLYRL